jgi:hypothetical protein
MPSEDSTLRSRQIELWYLCVSSVIQCCRQQRKVTLRTLFLALTNSRRCFSILCQMNNIQDVELYVIGQVAMALAIIEGRQVTHDIHRNRDLAYNQILRILLRELQGQVTSHTYWELVDTTTIFIGLIQEMSFTRQPWRPVCSMTSRVYAEVDSLVRTFCRTYSVDIRSIKSIELVCTTPLVQHQAISPNIKEA